jgi:hypothetical protein
VLSGGYTVECYELFVKHMNELVSMDKGLTNIEIDHLLMPLGQAIKKSTNSFDEFVDLCGFASYSLK